MIGEHVAAAIVHKIAATRGSDDLYSKGDIDRNIVVHSLNSRGYRFCDFAYIRFVAANWDASYR
jgi:hypothetical protein